MQGYLSCNWIKKVEVYDFKKSKGNQLITLFPKNIIHIRNKVSRLKAH